MDVSLPHSAARDLYVRNLLREIEEHQLIHPFFQREFVWSEKKQREFIQYTLSILQLEAPIHTYCVAGSMTLFLKDGRQRLTTLKRAIENPKTFGLTQREVEILKQINVHIMHRQHATHDEAMLSFQNLNKGTGLLPYDLWRGELTATDVGKRLYDRVCTAVVHVTARLAGVDVLKTADMSTELGTDGRKRNGQLNRGALALFYMWAAKKPTVTEILTHDTITKKKQPEVLVAQLIKANNWTNADVEREVHRFYTYLENAAALVERLVIARNASFNNTHKIWEIQSVRAIFNAAVFIHLRDDVPASALEACVTWYLDHADGYSKWDSRFDIPAAVGSNDKEECRMSQHNLYWIREPIAPFGVHIPRRKKKPKV
ncbi:MAG: DUF262 domain-containing protein, partial [Alphaproteobacteria bacterium]|nr:DUF262 domain-containing protein [Alphaproteobacteria bacterium]